MENVDEIDPRSQLHQQTFEAFLYTHNYSPFLVHIVWQTANKFGKKCANLSLKLRVLIIGEIEQQFFYSPATY